VGSAYCWRISLVTRRNCPRYIRSIGLSQRGPKMVEVDPAFDSRNAVKVLRSIEEWMVQQAHAAKPTIQTAGMDNCGPEKGTQPPRIVAALEPSFERLAPARRQSGVRFSRHEGSTLEGLGLRSNDESVPRCARRRNRLRRDFWRLPWRYRQLRR
jgi:hypothetical protein